MTWTQRQAHVMTPDVFRLALKARKDRKLRCNSLMGMLFRPDGLRASFERLAKNKAPGVDGIRKEDYADDLDARLMDLSGRLARGAYRPQPVRRVYIPKSNGGRRPLGIPTASSNYVIVQ
jgi:RNA-directed DNA polymerase